MFIITLLIAALLWHPVPALAADVVRPVYHFTPARNWINDPNGLVYLDGRWHLFYQYNPFGDRWGHMSWGHAESTDLLTWQELPVAIPEDPAYMIFSGSSVVDSGNSSGFGKPGTAPLVAIYTGSERGPGKHQNQQLAYSTDAARTWTKYPGNPVLDLGLHEFRDPKVFWFEPTGEWVMVTVLSDQRKVSLFGSKNLRDWHHLSDFGPAGAVDGVWECPDLIRLPVENSRGEERWLLKMDVFRSTAMPGSGAQYFVGSFDGREFKTVDGGMARPVDYGMDFYAAVSWSHVPDSDGRHLWIGWMNNHGYAVRIPTTPWRGSMSVPRTLSLWRLDQGFELRQAPVAELERWRTHHRRRLALKVASGRDQIIEARPAASLDVVVTLDANQAKEFGLKVFVGKDTETVIGYDVAAQQVFIDRTRSGRTDFDPAFAGRHAAPLALVDGSLTLRVLLDVNSVEVFAGNGGRVLTDQVFPTPGSVGLAAYARGGSATLRSLDLWDLEPARGP